MMLSSAIVAQVALVASSVLDESSNAVLFVSVVGTIAFALSGVMAAAEAMARSRPKFRSRAEWQRDMERLMGYRP